MKKVKEKKPIGKTISISPRAYEAIFKEAKNAKPRRTIRQQVNLLTNVLIHA